MESIKGASNVKGLRKLFLYWVHSLSLLYYFVDVATCTLLYVPFGCVDFPTFV